MNDSLFGQICMSFKYNNKTAKINKKTLQFNKYSKGGPVKASKQLNRNVHIHHASNFRKYHPGFCNRPCFI